MIQIKSNVSLPFCRGFIFLFRVELVSLGVMFAASQVFVEETSSLAKVYRSRFAGFHA